MENFTIKVRFEDNIVKAKTVKGELIPLVEGINTFIHRAYENSDIWVVSELTTGRKIVFGKNREEVIQEAKKILTERIKEAIELIKYYQ